MCIVCVCVCVCVRVCACFVDVVVLGVVVVVVVVRRLRRGLVFSVHGIGVKICSLGFTV